MATATETRQLQPQDAPVEQSAPQIAIDQREAADDTDQLQLVSFMVGEEEYAVNILDVQEINRMLQITKVPQSPPCVEGVINLRGRIIPVIDLRKRLGMQNRERTSQSRIVVVYVHGRVLGFVVDQVREVLRIDPSIVEPPPASAQSADCNYIKGVGKLNNRLLILLDLDQLLSESTL